MSKKLSILSSLFAFTAFSCAVDESTTTTEPSVATTEQASQTEACPANTPPALAPPAGTDLAFAFNAQGVQRYTCVGSTTGYTWTFIAPDADLFADHSNHQVMHHFAGPTWLYQDSSSVVAAKAAGATVSTTAIPWLLLNVVSHGGDEGRMSNITHIQRLLTTGGLAPAAGCDADHVGAEADVLYTARYFFYRASDTANPVRCGA